MAGQVRTVRADRGIVFPDFALWKPEVCAGPYWRRERHLELFPDEAAGIAAYYRFYDRMLDLVALSRRVEAAHGLGRLLAQLRLAATFLPLRRMASRSVEQVPLMESVLMVHVGTDLDPRPYRGREASRHADRLYSHVCC